MKLINYIYELIKKYKSVILYLIFGVLTTIINILTYALLTKIFNINYLISNVIAWLFAVIFAYITNKLYVFESKSFEKRVLIKEIISFLLARLFSLGFDMLFMYITVGIFSFNDMFMKILSNIVVVILNYVFSKFIIFKKKEK